MIFRQLTHDDLGCASYLIGDDDAGVAAVVDPRFEIDEYLELARYMGVHIDHVLETHNHADHVSGHGRLAAATGATIHVHRQAAPDYEHEPFDHGWELELGCVVVRALHTPGHRPEHCAFALIDKSRGSEPWAVLTGDTLFVGDIARPDLAVDREEGARAIFHSLHEQLLALAPETEVWPGHLGGSLCGGPGMDMKVSSTIGYERRHNELLAVEDEDRFVEDVLDGLGPQPPNFRAIGAVAITALHAGFGTKLAWIADREQEIVLVGRDDQEGRRAARLATAVGIRKLAGFLAGGMTAWRDEHRDVASIERLRAAELHSRAEDDPSLQILDVRERDEWVEGHIPGSVHLPYHDIHSLPDAVDPDRPVAAVCGSGQRSAVAASLVARFGCERVLHVVDGGVGTWERDGHPLERGTEGAAPARS